MELPCFVDIHNQYIYINSEKDLCNEVCKIAMESYSQDKMENFKVYNLVKQDNMTSIHDIEIHKYKGFVDNVGTDFMNIATEYTAIMEATYSNLELDGKLK